MAITLRKGFKGIMEFRTGTSPVISTKLMRFMSADLPISQEALIYTGSKPGVDIRQIFRSGTADINGTIASVLTNENARYLYDLAKDREEFELRLVYYQGQTKSYTGCKVNTLTFECTAGEVVRFNMAIQATGFENLSTGDDDPFTVGEKLVTWDKCRVDFPSGLSVIETSMSSFNYTIDNGLRTIKTHNSDSLFPADQNVGIQKVNGAFNVYNFQEPPEGTPTASLKLGVESLEFYIGDLIVRHDVVFHPAERHPLSPEVIVSTIRWDRVDDLG